MWCNHCQTDVTITESSENTGTLQCPQCSNNLSSTNESGATSIAQSAHALLKRWEDQRPVADSTEKQTEVEPAELMASSQPEISNPISTDASFLNIPKLSSEPDEPKVFSEIEASSDSPLQLKPTELPGVESVVTEPEVLAETEEANSSFSSNLSEEHSINDLQTESEDSVLVPKLVKPPITEPSLAVEPKTSTSDSIDVILKETSLPPEILSNKAAINRTEPFLVEKPDTLLISPEVLQDKQPKQPSRFGTTLASQNDASSLLKRDPDTISQLQQESSAPYKQPKQLQTETVIAQNNISEKPMKNTTQKPVSQPSNSQGRLRFSPAEDTEEIIDDLGIQQAIEKHHRKDRNWSVIFGQFMVYCGAIAMTCGIGIVIVNRFGSLGIAESTGWLTLAGGQLLFVLGIHTHLSNKMEQLLNDIHQRNDDLTRLILQQSSQVSAKTIPTPKTESISRDSSINASFQRGSLQETA
ncbi:MAG: hypothetical protein JKY95_00480 [Planctomycetaceae bacterium]|nr:hypothetical protein [Planctomycetaceae bacterium]